MSKLVLENKLSNGWVKTNLEMISEITSGKSAPQGEKFFKNGKYPFVRVADMGKTKTVHLNNTKDHVNELGSKKLKMFPKGSVLFTKSGASTHLNQKFILGMDSYVVSHIGIINPFGNISSEFIYYFLKTIDFKSLTHESVMPSLQLSKIKTLSFLLPPLNEQKRIVEKIDELFSQVDKISLILQEIEKKIKFQRISLIRWIFFGDFKKKNYAISDWKIGKISDFFDIIGGGTPSTKNKVYWNGKIPWITSADIHGIRDVTPRRTVSQLGIKNSATNIIPKNSILVVTRVGLGKLAMIDCDMCINQDIQGLIPKKEPIFPAYALHYLSETIQILKFQSRGTTISGVTKKQLSELSFVMLSIDEQKEISSFIDTQLSFLIKLNDNIKFLNKFTKNFKMVILKQAFEGKLVPQDPNDESVEILLQKIKQEKKQLIQKQKVSRSTKNVK